MGNLGFKKQRKTKKSFSGLKSAKKFEEFFYDLKNLKQIIMQKHEKKEYECEKNIVDISAQKTFYFCFPGSWKVSFITSGKAGRSLRSNNIQKIDGRDNVYNLQTFAGKQFSVIKFACNFNLFLRQFKTCKYDSLLCKISTKSSL